MSLNASNAINSTIYGEKAFVKFLSANDTRVQSHQSGIYMHKNACPILFNCPRIEERENRDRFVEITWYYEICTRTDSRFIYYGKEKNEYRITRIPSFGGEYIGALFVLVQRFQDEYEAFILNTDDEIDQYLEAFGLSPSETNRMIDKESVSPAAQEMRLISQFIEELNDQDIEFPNSVRMSEAARNICDTAYDHIEFAITNPDTKIIDWTNVEYNLFKAIEYSRYSQVLNNGFHSVDDFINMANQVLNRRKSRAGKSLENHLSDLFKRNELCFDSQVVTEGNKKPDFIFPSSKAYQAACRNEFPKNKIIFLAAKTTCKDRWRQILNEADLLRDGPKYLCTLQQGISVNQMEEMQKENVTLVVPEKYIGTYPRQCQDQIWSLKRFIEHVKDVQR